VRPVRGTRENTARLEPRPGLAASDQVSTTTPLGVNYYGITARISLCAAIQQVLSALFLLNFILRKHRVQKPAGGTEHANWCLSSILPCESKFLYDKLLITAPEIPSHSNMNICVYDKQVLVGSSLYAVKGFWAAWDNI
jgi:hypothetical protein